MQIALDGFVRRAAYLAFSIMTTVIATLLLSCLKGPILLLLATYRFYDGCNAPIDTPSFLKFGSFTKYFTESTRLRYFIQPFVDYDLIYLLIAWLRVQCTCSFMQTLVK